MTVIKNIFGRFYALWLAIWFAVTLLLVAIPSAICHYTIKDKVKRTAAILRWYRIWMKILMTIVFCRIKLKGRFHFKTDQNYVVVCNHNTLFDILVSTPSVPGASQTLAKAELAKIPVFGFIYRSGSILVNRKDPKSRRKSLDEMKKALKQGMHLILYPEGTRNKTSAPLKPFYDGAFTMAIETQKPVIPALIFYTKDIIPPGKTFYAWPHTVKMHFLEPVSTEGLTLKDVPALKEKIFRIMEAYYVSFK